MNLIEYGQKLEILMNEIQNKYSDNNERLKEFIKAKEALRKDLDQSEIDKLNCWAKELTESLNEKESKSSK